MSRRYVTHDDVQRSTYSLPLVCGNCGHTWEKQIEKGTIVKNYKKKVVTMAMNGVPQEWEYRDTQALQVGDEIIECPNCGIHEPIKRNISTPVTQEDFELLLKELKEIKEELGIIKRRV